MEELCTKVENTLGWVPIGDREAAVQQAANRLEAAQKKHPNIYSEKNLNLAIRYMKRERIFIHDPSDILLYVREALKDAGLRYDWTAA